MCSMPSSNRSLWQPAPLPIRKYPRASHRSTSGTIGGKLYVAYAKQDANKKFDVAGAGNGYVQRVRYHREAAPIAGRGRDGQRVEFALGSRPRSRHLRQVRQRPAGGQFRRWPDQCLRSDHRRVRGNLAGPNGKNIVIPGLWALYFGNGASGGDKDTLYFAAGPGGQKHGILGSISANPNIVSAAVTNAAQATARHCRQHLRHHQGQQSGGDQAESGRRRISGPRARPCRPRSMV